MKTVAIITAAGYGKRMGQPKQFLEIEGQPILARTIAVFEQTKVIDEIIVVVNQEDLERAKKFQCKKIKQVVAGGKERQDSVYNALRALPDNAGIVAIHDGARPFITPEIIEKAVSEAGKEGAVVVGVPVKDTIKQAAGSRLSVARTIDRSQLWQAQTPQVFKKEIILQAYHEAKDKFQVTDDAMLVEKLGRPVKMVMGDYRNIKVTTPFDLAIAQTVLKGEEK